MKKTNGKKVLFLFIFAFCALVLCFYSCSSPLARDSSSVSEGINSFQDDFPITRSLEPNGDGLSEYFWSATSFVSGYGYIKYTYDINLGAVSGGYVIYKIVLSQDYLDAVFEAKYKDDVAGNIFAVYVSEGDQDHFVYKGTFTTIDTTPAYSGWENALWVDDVIELGSLAANTTYYVKVEVTSAGVGSYGANLERYGIFDLSGIELSDITITTDTTYQTTGHIRAESFVVDNDASVVFKANTIGFDFDKRVILGSGFKVNAGCVFDLQVGSN